MTDVKKNTINEYPDLIKVIRSIQRIEGKDGCFAMIDTDCGNRICQWRSYCLKELKKNHLAGEFNK
jgi:hypothetical protein